LTTHVWGVVKLRTTIEERACDLAVWIIDNRATVRAAAKRFNISKSTVHKDMTERLEQIDRGLYHQVRLVLEQNKAERHLRGGDATRRKYKGETVHT
jgi:putative DeoR family transcriptional regulator (stage III sporulation protein D)